MLCSTHRRGAQHVRFGENAGDLRRGGAHTDQGQNADQNEARAQGRPHAGHHYGHFHAVLAAVLHVVSGVGDFPVRCVIHWCDLQRDICGIITRNPHSGSSMR